MVAKKGQTPGRVRNLLGVSRIYYKPSLGKFVIRKAGVIRRSDKVIARNESVAAAKPAKACKGKPWGEFVTCLSEEMKKVK